MLRSFFFGSRSSRASVALEPFTSSELNELMEGFEFKHHELQGIMELLKPLSSKYDIYIEDYPILNRGLRSWLEEPETAKLEEGNRLVATIFKSDRNLATVAKYWNDDYREFLATLIDRVYLSIQTYTDFNKEFIKRNGKAHCLPRMVYPERDTDAKGYVLGRDYITIDYALIPYIKKAIDYDSLRPVADADNQKEKLTWYIGNKNVETNIEKYAAGVVIYDIDINEKPVKMTTLKTISGVIDWDNPFNNYDKSFKYYFLRNFTFWWQLVNKQRTFRTKVERKGNLAAYAEELKCVFELSTFPEAYNLFTSAHTYFDKYHISVFQENVLENFILALKTELTERCKALDDRLSPLSAREIVLGALKRIKPYYRLGCRDAGLMNYPVRNLLDSEQITLFNAVEEIAEGQLYAYLASWAAAGILSFQYVSPSKEPQSVFWRCIKKVKLTKMGEYVLGLRHSYQPEYEVEPAGPGVPPLLLDPKELIITASNEAAVLFIRKGVGKRLGNNRYLLEHDSFVSQVSSVKKLEEKIERIKTLAEIDKFPPLWQQAFDDMRQGFHAISPLKTSVAYYKVDLSKEYVVKVFKTRNEVRKLIKMVEGGGFLVAADDVDRLNDILKEYGIVLPKPEVLCVTDSRSWRYRY